MESIGDSLTPALLGVLLSCPQSAESPTSSEESVTTYVVRKKFKDEFFEGGKLVKEVIRYGEISHRTILDIFGHLMFYDDLKFYARDPDASTYLVGKFEWDEDDCYFTVFKNTDCTEEYHTGCVFYEGRKFERYAMAMEPFITLGQIEYELEAQEEETSSSEAISSAETSPKEVQISISRLPEVSEEGGEGVLSSDK